MMRVANEVKDGLILGVVIVNGVAVILVSYLQGTDNAGAI